MSKKLRAKELSKSYKGRKVVKEVSFEVQAGEVVGLLGPNGAGKTTSFNMVAGLVRADSGEVHLGEAKLSGLPLYKRARLGLGYLPQEPTIFRGLSVIENFIAVYEALGHHRQGIKSKAQEMVERFNLEHVANNLGSQLSGGERRRVEMARTLIPKPAVILLDEPFAGVDPIAVGDIKKSINHISNQLAFIGAQTRKTDQQLNFLGERLTIVTAEVSELGDADLTKLVTDLQATIVNRDAAQAAFVKIGQQSLFDFLR